MGAMTPPNRKSCYNFRVVEINRVLDGDTIDVTIPGYEPKQIDPTFPSSIFTLTLSALGVGGMAKLNEKKKKEEESKE